uniref:Uncharacterized protein n=1 Tax=Anguilla anguilla TaxID=7936 RepID=A0A0E9QLI5_ANGAN
MEWDVKKTNGRGSTSEAFLYFSISGRILGLHTPPMLLRKRLGDL